MADKPEAPNGNGDNPWVAFARYAGLGLEVAVTVVISIYVGSRLDAWTGKSPLFLITCLVIGFVVAINILLKYSRMAGQDMKGDDGDETEK